MIHLSEEILNEYLDGALSASERATAEGHLAACPACRAQLDALQGLFIELASLPEIALTHDLSAAVVKALGNRQGVPRAIRWAVLAQALALIVILALAWPVLNLETALRELSAVWGLPSITTADLAGWVALQSAAWMQASTQISTLPAFKLSFSLGLDPPTILITLSLVSACLLWLVGNGLLLRPRAGSHQRRHS